MVITYLAKDDHDEKRLTSCGRPTLFCRTALLDEDGNPVAQGEVGEICVSGPLVSGGYWNKPEACSSDRIGQARQEGRPRAVLGGRGPRRRLISFGEQTQRFVLSWDFANVGVCPAGFLAAECHRSYAEIVQSALDHSARRCP
jgi:acyl-CoA synthetase (AMP-forming)/AMP-acid ligase II